VSNVTEETEEETDDSNSTSSSSDDCATTDSAVPNYPIGSLVVCVKQQIPKDSSQLRINPGDIVQGEEFISLFIIGKIFTNCCGNFGCLSAILNHEIIFILFLDMFLTFFVFMKLLLNTIPIAQSPLKNSNYFNLTISRLDYSERQYGRRSLRRSNPRRLRNLPTVRRSAGQTKEPAGHPRIHHTTSGNTEMNQTAKLN